MNDRKPKGPPGRYSVTDPFSDWGADEMNLCEFPLAVCGFRAHPQLKSITFEDQIFDEGNREFVKRKVVISASDVFGLPTPLDSDVLLVLMHLTKVRSRFTSPTVGFTRYEIINILGWDQSGRSYRRLEESLNRWASVTLHYNRAWWDRDKRRWRSQTFHVLESLELRGIDGRAGANDDGLSTFTWNSVIFASFQSHHLKRLDLRTYFRLQIPAARQAYRFLDKRFYRSRRFEMELRTFACEHIGFARNYDNAQLRRRLQPALTELENIGFLVPESSEQRFVKRKRGCWQIVLRRGAAKWEPAIEKTQPILQELLDRGIRKPAAQQLVRLFSEERIREKIALHDWMLQHRDPRISQNSAGYLAVAIRQNYSLPKGFMPETPSVKSPPAADRFAFAHQRTVDADARREQRRSREHRLAAIRYWQSLSEAEQRELEAAAIAGGDSELIRVYQSPENARFRNLLLKDLIVSYLRTHRQWQQSADHKDRTIHDEVTNVTSDDTEFE